MGSNPTSFLRCFCYQPLYLCPSFQSLISDTNIDTTKVGKDLGLDDLSYRTSLEIRSLVTLNICETAEQGEIDLSLKKVVLEPQLPGFINHKDDL